MHIKEHAAEDVHLVPSACKYYTLTWKNNHETTNYWSTENVCKHTVLKSCICTTWNTKDNMKPCEIICYWSNHLDHTGNHKYVLSLLIRETQINIEKTTNAQRKQMMEKKRWEANTRIASSSWKHSLAPAWHLTHYHWLETTGIPTD